MVFLTHPMGQTIPGNFQSKKSQVNYEKSGGSEVKESACNDGDLGLIPELGRSLGGGHGNLLQYSCLENPHGQRSLVGHSSWGCKELYRIERHSTGVTPAILIALYLK